jgi:hypothetical protein
MKKPKPSKEPVIRFESQDTPDVLVIVSPNGKMLGIISWHYQVDTQRQRRKTVQKELK